MKPPFKMIIETDLEQWRYDTWESKEPETIEWIKSFDPHNTFFDVGANIGVYSLYAASLYPDSLIYAFEPVRQNYIRLMQNIELNGFNNIIALPIGVSNIDKIDILSVKDNIIGSSGSQLGYLGDKESIKNYFIPVIRLDSLEAFDIPNYIKIDIDGYEKEVIDGALNILSSGLVESCLVEINKDKDKIVKIFEAFDFTTDNRFNKFPNHSRYRRQKEEYNTAENVIFTRRG